MTEDGLDFVHVSDCHIGPYLSNHLYSSRVKQLFGSGDAQLSHDVALCKALGLAFEDVRSLCNVPEYHPVPVVMSGDLTASGSPDDFAVAQSFFRSTSPSYTGSTLNLHKFELEEDSREALLQTAAAHGFTALLTGHTHDPCRHPFTVQLASSSPTVYELRCATTLQGPPQDGTQGFLLHRIRRSSGGPCTWTTLKYSWLSSRFVRELHPSWGPFVV